MQLVFYIMGQSLQILHTRTSVRTSFDSNENNRFGPKNYKMWKRLNLTTMGTVEVHTFCFTIFIFRRNTKEIRQRL